MMVRVLALVKRILRQFLRDKRTLALVLVAPVLVLWLVSLVFDTAAHTPVLAVVDVPAPLLQALKDTGADVATMTAVDAHAALVDARVDAVIGVSGMTPVVEVEGSDPAVTGAVMKAVTTATTTMLSAQLPMPLPTPTVTFLHGSAEMRSFDNFGPVLVGFIVFFFTFIVSGMSFVRERTSGTLERMLSTPLRRHELVVGYVIGFSVVVIAQATLITAVSVCGLGMMLAGSVVWLLLVVLLLALTALTLGMLLSAFANSEFQVVQLIPIVVVPQVFFSGLFPVENMSAPLRVLGSVLPLGWGSHAMREIMIRGGGFHAIAVDVAVLAGFVAVFMIGNVLALRKYRRL